ncbi:PREDICTED: uncharacterized protein LOC108759522 [Trachymyrmex cornetzi]|uniref:uncharacterized protein LOC108759522 n=1 Tax=Trachymyrmex cornetzi TaxID=471704 RepID=UPI00084F0B90|nr:PREDICTED: uncharacterized protein LOC108759522 [Trachymyrmex cornetzi]
MPDSSIIHSTPIESQQQQVIPFDSQDEEVFDTGDNPSLETSVRQALNTPQGRQRLQNGEKYKGTPGLYELIFKKIPNDAIYTENDKQTYKHILLTTNAHRRDNKARMPIKSNKGHIQKHYCSALSYKECQWHEYWFSVSALSIKVPNEIQRDVTDLRQQMLNMVTKEMIQRGVTDLRQQLHNIATKEMLETNEIQRGVTDLRQQMNNTVTKESLEKSFKTTGRDIIVRALHDMQKDSLKVYSDMEKKSIINVLSKYAWAIPLKSKNGNDVAAALSTIFREDERYPRNQQTDQGKEFYNATVQKNIVKRYNINHYSTYSVMKASVVERFNRTLKNNMWKTFTLNGSYKWIDELPRLLSDYNHRNHRTIGMRPIDVTSTVAKRLLSMVYSHVKIAASTRFKIGDPVRISKFKTIFEKGYTPNWSIEIFYIVKTQRTNPATYLLKDYQGKPIAGGFYEHELQRVSNPDVYLMEKILRKRGNKVYVKWLGRDSSHNSWIDKTDVL